MVVRQCKLQDSDGRFECRMPLDAALALAAKGDAYCKTSVNAAVPVFRRREREAAKGRNPYSPTQLTPADMAAVIRLLDEGSNVPMKRMCGLLGQERAERLIGYGVVANPLAYTSDTTRIAVTAAGNGRTTIRVLHVTDLADSAVEVVAIEGLPQGAAATC